MEKVEYKLTKKSDSKNFTSVKVGDIAFEPNRFVMIAGPCAIESEEQAFEIAKAVKESGAHMLRGGAFKPRTSPYSFQGLGEEGLRILKDIKKEVGIPVVTEAMDLRQLESVAEVADMIQVGSRNMQNFSLLKEVGKYQKPILLKRGMASTIMEWLLAAEYILEKGNLNVVLCERGIRSFDSETRNLLDLSAVALVRELSHLPVIVDPSHGTGRKEIIEPMSRAALACGAQGLIVEVHNKPKEALSDGTQAIDFDHFKKLSSGLKNLSQFMDIQYI